MKMLTARLHLPWLQACFLWLLLTASLFLVLQQAPAVAQQTQLAPALEASRHNLSYGRYDGLRIEGLAGLELDGRQGKFYRNMPGISGLGGLFDIISQHPDPLSISFYREPGGQFLTDAGRWLAPGFSLIVLEGPIQRFHYEPERFVRFGEGNFYATVEIPGTDIVPGMELYTREHFDAYTANSILWEAPDIGNMVLETSISGGTVDVGSILVAVMPPLPPIGSVTVRGQEYRRPLGYANPLEVNIDVESKRELPDGRCRVRMRAVLSPTFGNSIMPVPQETYTWFRWVLEDSGQPRIIDVRSTDILTVDVPGDHGDPVPGMIRVTVVASSFGPAVLLPAPRAPWPLLPIRPTIETNPFIHPPERAQWLNFAHSFASTLGDTETFLGTDCDKQPLEVTKEPDPPAVPSGGGDVTFWVTIRNTSRTDAVTVTRVTDDRLGDISESCTPSLPVTLAPGNRIDCRVTTRVTGDADSTVRNTVSAVGGYADDDTPVLGTATADVRIEKAEPVAECNSAVQAGGDAGGRVTVDLGDFVGKAGFTWEMYRIKDQMNVTVGGVTRTTGCVSGSGTFEIDVPPAARTALVEVVPNCEGTRGTAWRFIFECPLRSAVTPDRPPPVPVAPPSPTAWGAPIVPPPPLPAVLGPTGQQLREAEPNNSIAAATQIGIGDTVAGSISTLGDVDYFTLDIPAQGELTVSFTSMPPELDMAFRVLDTQGGQVHGWQAAPAPGRPYSTTVDIRHPGRYVLEVRDSHNNAFSPRAYTFVTSLIPTADPAEPNNSIETATPLEWNRTVAANILPLGDVDYYSVTVARQGQLTVSFPAAPPALDMAFRVLNAQGGQVAGWQAAPQPGAAFTGQVDLRAPGTYFIEVRDQHNNARDAAPYNIVVAFDPTSDPAEPNDSVETATPIVPGQRIEANILPLGDVDYYRIDLSHQGELTVNFPVSPPNIDMAFRVLHADGRQLHGWQAAPAAGQSFSAFVDVPLPGRYVIEVRDHHNNARSERPYAMVVSLVPTADLAEPNNSIETATRIGLSERIEANILPLGDVDYYSFRSPRPAELRVTFHASPPNIDMAFRVLNPDGRQLAGWQAAPQVGATFTGTAMLPAAGDYVVEVRDHHNNARSILPYIFSLSLD